MTLAEYRKRHGEPLVEEHGAAEGHEQAHPGPLEYLQIGLILAVITAVEVGIYYLDISRGLLLTMLVTLSIVKFSLVVLWFMHLKFDNRLFSTLFATGLIGTMILFAVVIAVQHAEFLPV